MSDPYLKPDLRTKEAKAAQEYMAHKGYGDLRPTGVIPIEDDDCWYFYYELPNHLLELEVTPDELGGYRRTVTALVQEEHLTRV